MANLCERYPCLGLLCAGKRWKLLRGQFQPGMWWSADPDPGEIFAAEGGALSTPAPLYSKPPNGIYNQNDQTTQYCLAHQRSRWSDCQDTLGSLQ